MRILIVLDTWNVFENGELYAVFHVKMLYQIQIEECQFLAKVKGSRFPAGARKFLAWRATNDPNPFTRFYG